MDVPRSSRHVGGTSCSRRQHQQAASPALPPPHPGVAEAADGPTRGPAVAGAFYPDDPRALREQVNRFLAGLPAPKDRLPLVALLVPHAGYMYSGQVAAYAYNYLKGTTVDTVVLVGPSHHGYCRGAALSGAARWRTPLGEVPVDTTLVAALLHANSRFNVDDSVHSQEHSLEVQLPFLQIILSDFKICPLVMTDFSGENCRSIGHTLAEQLKGKRAVLIASSDLAHYPAQVDARKVDKAILQAVETLDPEKVLAADRKLMSQGTSQLVCTMCGLGPVVAVMVAAKQLGADRAVQLDTANSGDVDPATRGRCVGYAAVAFVRSKPLSDKAAERPAPPATSLTASATSAEAEEVNAEQQKQLLILARDTLRKFLDDQEVKPAELPATGILREPRAVFVTLTEGGQLRGCIGSTVAELPLLHAVQSSAIKAAVQDPRFRPVRTSELKDITIEISVLSPMRLVKNANEITVGKHGVMVKQGQRSGLFLPQVAPEQGWDRETMLNELCEHKAGLPRDAWKTGADLYVFTAQHFNETELGLRPTKE